MTLIEIKNQVFQQFLSNDVFTVSTAVDKISFDTTSELSKEEKIKIIQIALEELQKIEIISKISDDKWLIRRNFLLESQSVDILPETASALAGFVNTYRKVSKIKHGEVDALQITDADIQMVCGIGSLLLNLLSNDNSN